jgi:hypothetical protein
MPVHAPQYARPDSEQRRKRQAEFDMIAMLVVPVVQTSTLTLKRPYYRRK